MISNPHHISAGRNRITLKSGVRFSAQVRGNDPSGRVLLIETEEGIFDVLPYADIDHASDRSRFSASRSARIKG